jgi:transposase
VLADKAYDADRIRASLREKGAFANIPPKANRRSKPYFSTWLYRERNLIERFFSKLKHSAGSPPATTSWPKTSSPWSNSPQRDCGSEFMSLRPSAAQLRSAESMAATYARTSRRAADTGSPRQCAAEAICEVG